MNIDVHEAIEIMAKYWKLRSDATDKKGTSNRYVFVGDVHGDINQFLLPLIDNRIITINEGLHKAYKHTTIDVCDVYVPNWTKADSNTEVYYVGDYIDEGLFSREIVCMMVELSDMDNVHFCIGNHDSNILGKYLDYKYKRIEPVLVRSYWTTMQKELMMCDDVVIRGANVKVQGCDKYEFLHDYLTPLFESFYRLFINKKLNVMYELDIDGNKYIVSHTIITNRAIDELSRGITRVASETDKRVLVNGNYDKKDINEAFRHTSVGYICANRILYNRSESDLAFDRNIVGHTPGGMFRDGKKGQVINIEPCLYDSERAKHCEPTVIGGKLVWYIDVLASAAFDLDNVSRPDYFYIESGKMHVSKDKALRLYYAVDKKRLVLQVYGGKTKFDGVRELNLL